MTPSRWCVIFGSLDQVGELFIFYFWKSALAETHYFPNSGHKVLSENCDESTPSEPTFWIGNHFYYKRCMQTLYRDIFSFLYYKNVYANYKASMLPGHPFNCLFPTNSSSQQKGKAKRIPLLRIAACCACSSVITIIYTNNRLTVKPHGWTMWICWSQ